MRKAFYGLAKVMDSNYRLKRILSSVIQIFVIWVLLMLLYWFGFEVIAALTF